jgi:hypothetical protein
MKVEDRIIARKNKGELYQKYIDGELEQCPYCGSYGIEICDRYCAGGNKLSLQMWCRDCDAEWDDACSVEYIHETFGPDPDLLKRRQDNEEISQQCS